MRRVLASLALVLMAGCSWPERAAAPSAPAISSPAPPDSAPAAIELARTALNRKEMGKYIEYLNLALKLDPNYQPALAELGMVQAATGDLKTSVATLTRACRLNPQDVGCRLNLASCQQKLGQTEAALQQLHTVQQLQPGNPRSYYLEGALYADQGQHARAIECFTQSYNRSMDAKVLVSRGISHLKLGDKQLARHDFQAVVDHCPDPKIVAEARLVLKRISVAP
jgi:tetratricopeptide (TPR) repeat protein